MMKRTLVMPGGMKKTSMVKMLMSMLIEMMGPSIMSVKEKARVISSSPKSLEKVLINLPDGVVSK